ncbi:hypothetical protein CTI12_AA090980 [Artemisia annua]|uniref:Uncharacterized protein n=1 Tax=Artemisia annua TaxID=35608 RepID=A0A2U1Q026_ARTAN|nr:hypothetical protein CTI12_AA090980 [Artemisia annua]
MEVGATRLATQQGTETNVPMTLVTARILGKLGQSFRELDIVVNSEVKDGCDEIENGGKLVTVTANDSIEANVDDQDLNQLPPEDNTLSDKEERKKEIEEKLKILNERKHKLVQVLKQILNAEEELWRRSNVQGITGRPIISLQVDVTNDSGLMSRDVTP